MKKKPLSPVHEEFKKVKPEDKTHLESFGVVSDSLRGSTDFKPLILVAKIIEAINKDIERIYNDITSIREDIDSLDISIQSSIQEINTELLSLKTRVTKLETPPIENLPN